MSNTNISATIQCLNDAFKSNVLDANVYDLKLNIFSDIINKRKRILKNYLMVNYTHNQPAEVIENPKYGGKFNEEYSSSSYNDTTPIDDSITVSQLMFPSELYKNSSNENNTDKTNF